MLFQSSVFSDLIFRFQRYSTSSTLFNVGRKQKTGLGVSDLNLSASLQSRPWALLTDPIGEAAFGTLPLSRPPRRHRTRNRKHTHSCARLEVVPVEDGGGADGGHDRALRLVVVVSDDVIKTYGGVVVDLLPVVPLGQVVLQTPALAAGEELSTRRVGPSP